ncbi:MAG: rod shape-determining protein MreC [Mastigocoleus sp. MO_167.B18]|nr:rod shape-determining protein MreC [Mastigocoleus sp. MO_167.B18]
MFTLRRWWERRGLQVGIITLILAITWMVRETQGSFLLELYQLINRPLEVLHKQTPLEVSQKDNRRIEELENRIITLQTQNQKLKSLLKYVEKSSLTSKPILARVVGRSADNWWQQVILNRGSADGIKKDYIVKAEGGLVGLIDNVTPNTSRVLLISDSSSRVGVTIDRTAAKGVLRGNSSTGEAELEFYEKVPNVKIGDFITTSTYSQKFPPGLAMGKIKSLDLKRLPASVAIVELSPPISSLDWVMVYSKATKNESDKPQ